MQCQPVIMRYMLYLAASAFHVLFAPAKDVRGTIKVGVNNIAHST